MVDADLSKYFDTIPHSDLLKSVARRIVHRHVLHLIKMGLEAPVEDRDEDGTRRMKSGKSDRRGTPQGGVVSPLLANLYMNRFLKHWRLTGRGEALKAQRASDQGQDRRNAETLERGPVAETRQKLNRLLLGWSAYFGYGSLARGYRDVDHYVVDHVRAFLARRHKTQNRGARNFSRSAIDGELEVVSL